MSIQNTASLIVAVHEEGRADALKEFLELAKRMDCFLDHAADYGHINSTGRELWKDVRAFIDKQEAAQSAE